MRHYSEIIIAPVVTEKSMALRSENVYTFKVAKDATKTEIKKAIEDAFKVEVKRSDKNFEVHSMDMNHILGGCILKNIENMKVDVHNPDVCLHVEIRPYKTYLYTKT